MSAKPELTNWRRDIHAHPEIAFEEHRTAKIVAEKLEEFGLEVETGIAGTGVVGRLTKGRGNRAIGLRADLDADPGSQRVRPQVNLPRQNARLWT